VDERSQRQQTILDTFLGAVSKPNARKVLSVLLNQLGNADLENIFACIKTGVPNTVDLYEIPGAELFVHKDTNDGTEPIVSGGALHKYYNLELSEDGNTATVTLGICKNISIEGDAANKYGAATIVQRSTIDLTKDIPEITNVTFSQKFTSDIKGLDPKDYLFS